MGEVPWSRTLQTSMDCIQLRRTVLSRKSGTRVSTRFISRLEGRNNITNSLRYTKVQVKTKLNLAYKNYYELKKNASQLRKRWLKDLAAIKAQKDGSDQETVYTNMLHRENSKERLDDYEESLVTPLDWALTKLQ